MERQDDRSAEPEAPPHPKAKARINRTCWALASVGAALILATVNAEKYDFVEIVTVLLMLGGLASEPSVINPKNWKKK